MDVVYSVNDQGQQLIAEAIDNALQLELALLFGARPGAVDTAASPAERLGQSREAVETAADDLTAKRLLQRRTATGRAPISYALTDDPPARARLTALAERCAADEAFARELRAQFAPSRTRWLLEQILEEFASFAALRTRQRLALQFVLMGLVAVVLRHALRLPPEAVRACNAEIPLPPGKCDELRNHIHLLLLGLPDVVFTAFTPKQQHLTMTIVGTRDMDVEDLDRVTSHPQVAALLGNEGSPPTYDCRCRPRYVVRDGRNMYTDRLILIGDAACSRLYKNGLESALVTAELAAKTIIRHGVSRRAFAQHYGPACRRRIIADNACGRIVFLIHRIIQRMGGLLRANMRLMREDSRAGEELREIIWALFTGAQPYKRILRSACSPRLHLAILKHGIAGLLRRARAGDR